MRYTQAVSVAVQRAAAIGILECIAIQTPQGSALMDDVITHLAQHLA